jgi:hypothetical protein
VKRSKESHCGIIGLLVQLASLIPSRNNNPAQEPACVSSKAFAGEGFAQKVNKSTREAVSEPEAVATGSGWVKTFIEKTGIP